MQIILSHVNIDFDGFASMIAAKKLYPDATLVITDKQNAAVKQFLAIYRDSIELYQSHLIDWDKVTHLIIVDVASLQRVGEFAEKLKDNVTITVYDHHPPSKDDVVADESTIEFVGATVTLLVEEIKKREIDITPFEATIFGLGVYTDTGSFSYSNTTPRDLLIGSYLLEKGMNLELINRFSDQMLFDQQQEIFNQLLVQSNEYQTQGLNIMISTHRQKKFQGGLSTLTRKLLETTGADAVIVVVEMSKRVYVVGRADSNRVNLLPLMAELGGGGHEKAASATIKKGNLDEIMSTVVNSLDAILKPAITAKAIMASPVKTIAPTQTIDDAAKMMYRYGHTGFPVCEEGKLIGIISRRDLDKATHHGLGHAPVKAYMSTNPISITPTTSLEEVQNIMIKHDIGRLPVLHNGQVVGILSRSNVIEMLHNEKLKEELQLSAIEALKNNVRVKMKNQLPIESFQLLKQIGECADNLNVPVYMIGGIVRDIILGRSNEDIDVVIEGDGIEFAEALVSSYGGEVKIHETFGTATWKAESGMKIDVTSSRTEYYDHPAALPTVELSNLREDLYRRDFTINAMAIKLNQSEFGDLVDFFHAREDIEKKLIRTLHNLSFVEDPTRILRAVRFEKRFGFKMDSQSEELAKTSIDKSPSLSKVRLSNELQKLFNEDHPVEALERLNQLGFWKQLNPNARNKTDIEKHALIFHERVHKLQKNVPTELGKNAPVWFCYLLIPFYKQPNWKEHISQYSPTNKERKLIDELHFLNEQDFSKETLLHQQLKKISSLALIFFGSSCEETTATMVEEYIYCRARMPVLITGDDLKEIGIKPGPIFSKILVDVEIAYLNKNITSREDALEWIRKR
ncbi:CBS domain-containing protein [Bacillus sp. FJAT-45350]|uniref:CBS domain-containing protein n=1 Tax=Bacillus sp. FJAT-45350 TaxID=2011014 RepID=UPI000BB8281B|nr:CBS domain-containing protein [Bacillus sp. FJAT-45350]